MNDILKYFTNRLSNDTMSLKNKGILIEKPWALIDDAGEIQKLIFKKDKGLILSKNGIVSEGKWDYFPEARSLLINRGHDKLLLNEMYIDNNVLIMKKDGTENDFYTLANENTVPDLNVPNYLNSLECKRLNIREDKLLIGNTLRILDYDPNGPPNGKKVKTIDDSYQDVSIEDGKYLSKDLNSTYYVKDGLIDKYLSNRKLRLSNGQLLVIEGGRRVDNYLRMSVTINGESVNDQRVKSGKRVFDIANNCIMNVFFLEEYQLSNGWTITVEQRKEKRLQQGDRIIESTPISPIPNGNYRIKGWLGKIRIINEKIVNF